jgi:thioredoxin-disulfide reductase
MAETYDLIIIGGGPAGIAAGIYGARKALKILLITKDFIGQTGKTAFVENYPGLDRISGLDLMGKFKNHLKQFPIEIKEGEYVKGVKKEGNVFEIETSKGEKFQSKAVIAVPGGKPRTLNVPGEEEFSSKGVSYCSICDAPLFRDKTVVVVGGGNAGFEAAVDLLPFAAKIYILEIGPKVIADEVTQKEVEKSGKVQVILNAKILEIKGTKTVEELIYQDLSSNQTQNLTVQGVFVQVGSVPATDFLKSLVDLNQWEEIVTDPKNCATRTPGLFAAGDATDVKYKQIGVAVGDGIKAILSAYEYLKLKSK